MKLYHKYNDCETSELNVETLESGEFDTRRSGGLAEVNTRRHESVAAWVSWVAQWNDDPAELAATRRRVALSRPAS